jgi:microcystin-dependent protein
MSRNGSGTYTLPAGNPVVTNTVISSTWANSTLTDLATAMTGSVAADGQTPMTGNLNLGNNKIINLTDPTSAQEAATKAYVDSVGLTVAPSTAGNVLTSNGTIWTSAAPATVPTGSMLMWSTATAPTGYLICAGAAVSRVTYATLYAVIGTTYGVGDGSTTFNLPDLRGRSPFGVSGSYALASTGGSADAVVVSHTHTATSVVTPATHQHFIANTDATGANSSITLTSGNYLAGKNGGGGVSESYALQGTGTTSSIGLTSSAATGDTVATTNASTGVSGTGANLSPYLAINFIIKT